MVVCIGVAIEHFLPITKLALSFEFVGVRLNDDLNQDLWLAFQDIATFDVRGRCAHLHRSMYMNAVDSNAEEIGFNTLYLVCFDGEIIQEHCIVPIS